MKKLLAVLSVAALFAPALAFAAADTVSLDTHVAISVGGIEVDIASSPATVESLVVNTNSTFTFALESGSSIKISAPNLNVLNTDTSPDITASVCNGSESSITYVGTAARTVTITPSASVCASASGGGGGGGGSVSTTPVTTPAPVTPTAPTTPVATPAVTTPATTPAAASSSGLSATQVQSILGLLESFNADPSVIANVKASLGGSPAGTSVSATFAHNLTVGSTGADVKALQQYLNLHGAAVAATGAGSTGNETSTFGPATKAALMKFQKAHGITPASGYFGAKTRAYIQANP